MATAEEESDKKWTHERKTLLLTCRLAMEPEFQSKRKKRVVLWQAVLVKIKSSDPAFPFTRDDITRKFLNFMVTYRRIKKRNNTSGEAATSWEYYDDMDQVYGSRSDITVPEYNLDSSLAELVGDLTCETAESVDPSMNREATAAVVPRKRVKNVLEFLEKEAVYEKEVLDELLKCEKERIEIEKLKLDEIRKLREALVSLNM